MKAAFTILFIWIHASGHAQGYTSAISIEVAVNKTTSLLFPSAIVSVDRGSNGIMVQKSAENILKVKAVADSMKETNLTVVTADGKLYSFLVNYHPNPLHLILQFGQAETVKFTHALNGVCSEVTKLKNNLAGLQFTAGKMSIKLLGWYVRGAQLYCKIKIENRSQIGYDIDRLHFYLRDNHAVKRAASQEIILRPAYLQGDTGTIRGRSARIWVVAMEKFTIPDDKHFAIEILEKNGGRHLYLKSFNRQLMLAKEF